MSKPDAFVVGVMLGLLTMAAPFIFILGEPSTGLCHRDVQELYYPETLVAPVLSQFLDPNNFGTDEAFAGAMPFYDKAVIQFENNGSWATLEDGTECKY